MNVGGDQNNGSETKVAWTNIETVKTGRHEWIQGMLRNSDLNETVHTSRKERGIEKSPWVPGLSRCSGGGDIIIQMRLAQRGFGA